MLFRVEIVNEKGKIALEKVFSGDAPVKEKKIFDDLFEKYENIKGTTECYTYLLYYLDPIDLGGSVTNARGLDKAKRLISEYCTSDKDFQNVFGKFYDEFIFRESPKMGIAI